MMKCPLCHFEQSDGDDCCRMCGVVFAKLTGRVEQSSQYNVNAFEQFDRINHLDKRALTYGAWGFGLSLLAIIGTLPIFGKGLLGFFVQLPHLALGGMSTLFHEFGHAVFGWLAGRASIPAFDLRYGGGVTIIPNEQKTAILVLIYMGLAYGIYHYRRNFMAVCLLLLALACHAIYAFSGLDQPIILLMGHGTELVFATLAIFRGLTGQTVAHELERLAYSLVGWFLVLHNLTFSWGLMASGQKRFWYGRAKGGGHWMDFDQIARRYLHVELPLVAGGFVICCLLAAVLPILIYRYRWWVCGTVDHLLDPDPARED